MTRTFDSLGRRQAPHWKQGEGLCEPDCRLTAPPASHIPRNGYTRDNRGKMITFTAPKSIVNNNQIQQMPALHSLIESLPTELMQLIALELHPVDRICFALSSPILLRAIFSQPLLANRPCWTHFLAPTIDPSPDVEVTFVGAAPASDFSADAKASIRRNDSNPKFAFTFHCIHDKEGFWRSFNELDDGDVASALLDAEEACFTCYENDLMEDCPHEDIRLHLLGGWKGLKKSEWGMCDGCETVRSNISSRWNDLSWQKMSISSASLECPAVSGVSLHETDITKLRWDKYIHNSSSPKICNHKWPKTSATDRLTWLTAQWTKGRVLNVNRPQLRGEWNRSRGRRGGGCGGVNRPVAIKKMRLCPICLYKELFRCERHRTDEGLRYEHQHCPGCEKIRLAEKARREEPWLAWSNRNIRQAGRDVARWWEMEVVWTIERNGVVKTLGMALALLLGIVGLDWVVCTLRQWGWIAELDPAASYWR